MKKLALGFVALSACTAAVEPAGEAKLYACDDQSNLEVAELGDRAVVRHAENEVQLKAKPMSIGRRFASNEATLILDEDRAVYVEETGIIRHCLLSADNVLAKAAR